MKGAVMVARPGAERAAIRTVAVLAGVGFLLVGMLGFVVGDLRVQAPGNWLHLVPGLGMIALALLFSPRTRPVSRSFAR
jgi:hypothetical protein